MFQDGVWSLRLLLPVKQFLASDPSSFLWSLMEEILFLTVLGGVFSIYFFVVYMYCMYILFKNLLNKWSQKFCFKI